MIPVNVGGDLGVSAGPDGFVGWFAMQMAVRAKLWKPPLRAFRLDHLGGRFDRFFSEVIFQTRVIRERPVAGVAHLFVFWGFCAFGGFTAMEALRGLGLVDVTHTDAARVYRLALVPFALVGDRGMLYLLVRRAILGRRRWARRCPRNPS
jgi:hypothetical protein